ncbi:damage-control phosphatase ARMT1 family protein [Streptomyces hainanensis]|uniref:Protein-glutamate O-methyltransferase family protein n=1 Tax=Streptomyces hainanensis TaxID=402648 RepID=A0A4R4TSA7_9ACTN|nr:damage-control phosphatase ARMT1 family protein [Streptomyces hainanensis]TDC78113.1 protein-glutamate O-methyltransferase family protein [Streptomyces hainanensis]
MTANPHEDDAPVIRCDEPGSFARDVLATRHPALIRQVRDAHPHTPDQHRALDALLAETRDSVLRPLPADAHDHAAWAGWGMADHVGRSWFDAPFLWAESYFYRRLLGAVDHFAPGPWQGLDPFAPVKRAELHGTAVDEELRAMDALPDLSREEEAATLVQAAVWGNRADLGFLATGADPAQATGDLVADDSDALWAALDTETPGTVAVIADNAGRELIPDLVLIDHLLRHGHARTVVLHLKPQPYYVSDATPADLVDALRRLSGAPGHAGEIGGRLWQAVATGSLRPSVHPFFCAPLPYAAMPDDLRRELATATLTILKGDLNYRRLVGDRLYRPTASFDRLTGYFPTPVAALRTLKSDVVAGLTAARAAALDATGDRWRTSGTHALIQVRR